MTDRRSKLKQIAQSTLDAIEKQSYTLDGTTYDLSVATADSKRNTAYYAPDSLLSQWASGSPASATSQTNISVLEVSTLEGMRFLHDTLCSTTDPTGPIQDIPTIGVLNFASARKPGGGFLSGAQAQEESLARASTLYPTLMTRTAQAFYTLHNRDPKAGYYTHAMVYSPRVAFVRDDAGAWLPPLRADVLTSAAVNAGVVRQSLFGRTAGAAIEGKIADAMRERMARVLYLFEQQGVRHLVLGSFGTGVFKNSVETVAHLWVDLLAADQSRFANSFETVVFAILGKDTVEMFQRVFEARGVTT